MIKPRIHLANVWANAFVRMHTMHLPQLCPHSHWRPHVTKWTGISVFIVPSLRIFRHFQNFLGNSLLPGKIWRETRGCHRQARMSKHSDPDVWLKLFPEPPKITQWRNWIEQMFAHTYTFVQHSSRISFRGRSFTTYPANVGKLWTDMTKRIHSC